MPSTMTAPQIQLHLGDPSMTLMHRAGLAGLWMTLEQLESTRDRPGNLNWQRDARSVSLSWDGSDREVLDWLLGQAFRVDGDGLIALTGLNPQAMDRPTRVTVHQGILGTLLQHNKTHQAVGRQTIALTVDEQEVTVEYKALKGYVHQTFASKLCDGKGKLQRKPIDVAGWIVPGATVRHVAFSSQTSFQEPPEMVLALLFAPVGCQFFALRSHVREKRAQFALVVPEVQDLAEYAWQRQKFRTFGYRNFHVSGVGDAGLRFLTYKAAAESMRKSRALRCQVITLGTVPWASQQKTRTAMATVEADYRAAHNYKRSQELFSDRVVDGPYGRFVATSLARELIADNLAQARPWYAGLAEVVKSSEFFQQLTYEREGLNAMVHQAEWDDNTEKLFVQACHQALRQMYGQMAGRAKERGEQINFDRENEKIRVELSRCKNADSFRQFITDFWSRAGQINVLQENWQDLLPLATGDRGWKRGRDLALLALASYKKPEQSERGEEAGEREEIF